MIENKYTVSIVNFLWALSLYIILFSFKKPNIGRLLTLATKCECAGDFVVSETTASFDSLFDVLFRISFVGFISVFFITRGKPWWLKSILILSWFGLIVLANPAFR